MAVDIHRLKELFGAAAELPVTERSAFLDRECGGDAELRRQIEELLQAHKAPGSFLAGQPDPWRTSEFTPLLGDDERTIPPRTDFAIPQSSMQAGTVIGGRYKLVERIGEGGMGEVWVANQTEPVTRRVALKLIKTGMDSRAVVARFEQERQALAMMDHPNIARVLDGGMTASGQPFFVMELVDGQPLTKFCDDARLTPRERLELFVPICQAIQHAHQKGIIHRDLKPANILVTLIDGRPSPKVIDFGVAKATAGKLTDASLSTQMGAVIGTLEYMSPEQAGAEQDIDTRADIYSLGVILYELLTGLRPIDVGRLKKAALLEMVLIIVEEEPSKPSTRLSTAESLPSLAAKRQIEPRKLLAMLRGELDWVVMKCLEKDRSRRYETASGLARDIQRYLADEVVEARPPSTGYRVKKFIRRHKGQVIAASLILLALLAGIAGTGWGLIREAKANEVLTAKNHELADEQAKVLARETQAIDAVKKFRDAVANEPELKNTPSLEKLRRRLLNEPLVFFKELRARLQADSDTRPESLERLAIASQELGTLTSDIGDMQDSVAVFRESLALYKKLCEDNPSVSQFRVGLAVSHHNLANLLGQMGKHAESEAAFRKAIETYGKLADDYPTVPKHRSDVAGNHSNLGLLLSYMGRPTEAEAEFRKAISIQEKLADEYPEVTQYQEFLANHHTGLGNRLWSQGKLSAAAAEHRKALAIEQKLADDNPAAPEFQYLLAGTLNNLGNVLAAARKYGEAEVEFRKAIAISSKVSQGHPTVTRYRLFLANHYGNLANVLMSTDRMTEAEAEFRREVALRQKLAEANPNVAEIRNRLAKAHAVFGLALLAMNRPTDAEAELRTAIELDPRSPEAKNGLTQIQRRRSADQRITAFLKGKHQPTSNDERLEFLELCTNKKLYRACVQLSADLLVADAALADDPKSGRRFNAACYASLAAAGQGEDAANLDDAVKARLRKQAYDWLRADLALWTRLLESGQPADRADAQKMLKQWQEDNDVIAIRDPAALAKLPAVEQKALAQLWADVAELLKKVAEKPN